MVIKGLLNKDQLNAKDILHLIRDLCDELERNKIEAHITIAGGAAMMYYFPSDYERRTQDVDAAFAPIKIIEEFAEKIYEEWNKKYPNKDLDRHWLSNEIVVSDNVVPKKFDTNTLVYYCGKFVKADFVNKECLLSSKAMSMVERASTKDINDFKRLCKDLNILNSQQVLEIFKKYWTNKQLQTLEWDEKFYTRAWDEVIHDNNKNR